MRAAMPACEHVILAKPLHSDILLLVTVSNNAMALCFQMNETMSYLLEGELDLAALERAANLLLDRHQLLRCAFKLVDGMVAMELQPEAVLHVKFIKVGAVLLGTADSRNCCRAEG